MEKDEIITKNRYRHTYQLRCYYPNTQGYHQTFTKDVKADRFEINKGGSIIFYNKNYVVIALYPTQYTRIEKVIENE